MRSFWSCLFVLPLIACVSNSTSDEAEAVQAVKSALVGGHVASATEYPATVWTGGCTATKVGSKHFLLAAHCIEDENRKLPEDFTTFSMTPNRDRSNLRDFTVASAHIHPNWTDCPNCACKNEWICDLIDTPDLALVIVNEESPDVAEAVIDDTPVMPGDGVVLTGYGCDNGDNRPSTSPGLKLQNTVAIPADTYNSAAIGNTYVVTHGITKDANSASLCPGDSGGPLYRQGKNRQLVVGINALMAWTDDAGIAFANWHTRLDTKASVSVFQWLKDLGVNVETGSTCGDGIKNGKESDVDCGGDCAKCETTATCVANADCMSHVCSNGVCAPPTHSGPCNEICKYDTIATSQYYASGSLGTGERCIEVPFSLASAACGSFANNRVLSINGIPMTCAGNSMTLPAMRNGGYCLQASAGQDAWAWVSTW